MVDLANSRVQNRHRIQPNDTNHYGTAHGGVVMLWMDETAALSAVRFAGEWCVTAHIHDVDFFTPVPAGDTLFLDAYVYAAGQTSCTIRLRAYREDPKTGDRELTTDSQFVFVAVDEERQTVSVPALETPTDEEAALQTDAIAAFENDECA